MKGKAKLIRIINQFELSEKENRDILEYVEDFLKDETRLLVFLANEARKSLKIN